MMKFEETWRWFGPYDTVTLQDIKQTGSTGIVSALHHLPNGVVWPVEEIEKRKAEIEAAGLRWSVVESIPVHEDIKKQQGDYKIYIENYRQSIRNLGTCGIETVCYNFMPVLDWTRTDLDYVMPDGSTALRFDENALTAFDLFILEREDAEKDYSDSRIKAAEAYFKKMSQKTKESVTNNILAGLPGAEEGYSLESFREILKSYDGIDDQKLRTHLYEFLAEIMPAAEESGVRMAIHPDDPPFPIFGLPRVVSTEADAKQLVETVASPNNGLTFCTGSYGARADNDLPGIVDRLGAHIHFVHLRSVHREEGSSFHEADHLAGHADMGRVMAALIREQIRRKKAGRTDLDMPFRPDHGHAMLADLGTDAQPGYTCIGRMRGLAELRGLELGLRMWLESEG